MPTAPLDQMSIPSNAPIAARKRWMVKGFPKNAVFGSPAAPSTASPSGVPLMNSTGVFTPFRRTMRINSTPLSPGNR